MRIKCEFPKHDSLSHFQGKDKFIDFSDQDTYSDESSAVNFLQIQKETISTEEKARFAPQLESKAHLKPPGSLKDIPSVIEASAIDSVNRNSLKILNDFLQSHDYIHAHTKFEEFFVASVIRNMNLLERRELYKILLTEYAHHIAIYLLNQSEGVSKAEKLYKIIEPCVLFINPIDQFQFYVKQGDSFFEYLGYDIAPISKEKDEFYISNAEEKVNISIVRAYSNALCVADQQKDTTSESSQNWTIQIEQVEKRLRQLENLNLAHLYLDLETGRQINANTQYDELLVLLESFEKGLPKYETWQSFEKKFEKLIESIPISFLRIDELYLKLDTFLNDMQNTMAAKIFETVKSKLKPLKHELRANLNVSCRYQALRDLFIKLYPLLDNLLILGAQKSINCIYRRLRPWADSLYKLIEASLSKAKGRSLNQFLEVYMQIPMLIDPWLSHNQYSIARPCYQAVIVHADQKATSFKDVKAMIQKVNQCDASESIVSPPSHLKSEQISLNKTFNQYRTILFDAVRTRNKPITRAQADFTQQVITFFQILVEKAQNILGKAPCDFAILGIGSISRQELSPASDLDIALLVEHEQYRSVDYFQTLIKAIKLQLSCLGEHKSLLPDSGDLSHLKKMGDLIDTPKGLANRYPYEKIDSDHPESHSLHRAIKLYSSNDGKKLFSEYQQNIRKNLDLNEFKSEEKQPSLFIHPEKKYKHQIFALCQLEKILDRKSLSEVKINIKMDYIRPIMLVCSHLVMYFGWTTKEGTLIGNITLILRMLTECKIFTPTFAQELHIAWEYLQRLRINAYVARLRSLHLSLKCDELYWPTEKLIDSSLPEPLLLSIEQAEMLKRIDRILLKPLFQVLKEWINNKIELKAPLDPVIFQVQKLYTDPQKVASLLTPQSEDQKTIAALIETLYQRKVSPKSYLEHYKKLPDCLKNIFLNVLDQPPQKHIEILPSKLISLIAEYADNLEHPFLATLKVSFNAIWENSYITQLENDLFLAIGSYPLSNGFRYIYMAMQHDWQEEILRFTQPLPKYLKELLDSNQVSEFKKELRDRILVQWIESNGRSITRLLKTSLQEYWLKKGWINDKNIFQPAARNAINVKSQRIVVPIRENDHDPIFAYAKIYPEFPGIQRLTQSLAWRLSGTGPLTTLCKFTTQNDTYPVLFSQPVDETLQAIAKVNDKNSLELLEENLKQNPSIFTRKFLETLLCNYEDDKLDNLGVVLTTDAFGKESYRLVSFDSDRAFVDPVYKEQLSLGNLLKRKYKVNVKSILYCMDQMLSKLDEETVQEFLSLDIYQLLLDWLTECEVIENAYCEKIFTYKELQRFSNHSENASHILGLLGPEVAGTIKAVYQKFHRIQATLSDKQDFPANHLEVFQRIDPQLANFYEVLLANKSLTSVQRFESLPSDYIIVEEKIVETTLSIPTEEIKQKQSDEKIKPELKGLILSQQSFSKTVKYQDTDRSTERTIKSLLTPLSPPIKDRGQEISKSINKSSLFSLKQAKADLASIDKDYHRVKDIRSELVRGITKQFSKLENEDYIRERVFQGIKFPEIKESWVQEKIVDEMKGGKLQNIYLSGCIALDNFALITIFSRCPNLKTLDISDCEKISMTAVRKIPNYCQHLQKLNLSHLPKLKSLSEVDLLRNTDKLSFPKLRHLIIDNCYGLTHIEIEAPLLETISTENSYNLREVIISGTAKKFLKVDGNYKLNLFSRKVHGTQSQVILCYDLPSYCGLYSHKPLPVPEEPSPRRDRSGHIAKEYYMAR